MVFQMLPKIEMKQPTKSDTVMMGKIAIVKVRAVRNKTKDLSANVYKAEQYTIQKHETAKFPGKQYTGTIILPKNVNMVTELQKK